MVSFRVLGFVLVAPMLLASCFWNSSDTTSTNTTTYSGDRFSLSIPSSWVKVEAKTLPTPREGSIVLALSSSEVQSGFANNLVIIRDSLNRAITSEQYAIANFALSSWIYKEFLKLTESKLTFDDGETSKLYTFEAKYSMDTPKQKFIQTARVCGKEVYLATIGIAVTTDDTSRYESLLKTLACK